MKFRNRMQKLMQLIVENYNPSAKLKSLVKNGRGEIYLYDVISDYWGIGPSDIAAALKEIGDRPVDLYINSPGGDVFDGRAIKTILERHDHEVVAYIDGIAASAASTVACGADRRVMAKGTRFMIHNAWTIALGNSSELLQVADLLDKLDDDIANDYVGLMDADKNQVLQFMAEETYFSAEDCLENGLCDEVTDSDSGGEDEGESEAGDDAQHQNLERLGRFAQCLRDIG